MKKYS